MTCLLLGDTGSDCYLLSPGDPARFCSNKHFLIQEHVVVVRLPIHGHYGQHGVIHTRVVQHARLLHQAVADVPGLHRLTFVLMRVFVRLSS